MSNSLQSSVPIVAGWIYSWLILYTLPDSLKADGILLMPVLIALSLHFIYADFRLGSEYPG